MLNIILVGLGGFIGSILRFVLNNVIYSHLNYPLYPYGTFIVNVSGCLLIGVIAGLAEHRLNFSPELRIFIQIGILGGYTTFSTFGYETFGLLRDGQFMLGLANVLSQVIVGILAVWLGYFIVQ